jgi:hypothetical protein
LHLVDKLDPVDKNIGHVNMTFIISTCTHIRYRACQLELVQVNDMCVGHAGHVNNISPVNNTIHVNRDVYLMTGIVTSKW